MVVGENNSGENIYPRSFFGQSKIKTNKGSCFVIMPFDPKMDEVYSEIRNICKEFNLTAIRADEIYDVKPIMISIMRKIGEADIVIADLTGRNPNVFYELGISHRIWKMLLSIYAT